MFQEGSWLLRVALLEPDPEAGGAGVGGRLVEPWTLLRMRPGGGREAAS